MKLIGVSNPIYNQLKEIRDNEEHTSFDSAIRELLLIRRYRNDQA